MIDSKKKEENRKMRGWEKMWRRDMNRVKKKKEEVPEGRAQTEQ